MMNSITLILIGLNIYFSFKGFNNKVFFNRYKFNPSHIKKGEVVRFISSGFLHVNTTHLFVNMLTLYFFIDLVVIKLGIVSFLIIYFVSLFFGNWLTYNIYKKSLNYNAVGASGAVMGVLYSYIILNPYEILYLFAIVPIPAFVFGIGYLFYSVYSMKNLNDNIGHEAHLGGAIAGLIITTLLQPKLLIDNFFVAVLLLIPIVYFYIKNRKN